MLSSYKIKEYARRAGFTLCGIARARVLSEHAPRFAASLEASGENALHYLADRPERRLDPSRLLPGAKTVIVCAVNYRNGRSSGYPGDFTGPKICSYGLSTSYQPKIKAMLAGMLGRMKAGSPEISGRAFCDTSAILEKAWAAEAGLGWIGCNSLLVNPGCGSFMLLGGLVVDAACDSYDAPYEGAGCGDCRRCMEACPVGALPRPCTLDTGRCISALTIEKSDKAAPEQLHGWIFGCDECQNACPWNSGRPQYGNPAFAPVFDPADFPPERWRTMDEGEFRRIFDGTPLVRMGLEKIKKSLPVEKTW